MFRLFLSVDKNLQDADDANVRWLLNSNPTFFFFPPSQPSSSLQSPRPAVSCILFNPSSRRKGIGRDKWGFAALRMSRNLARSLSDLTSTPSSSCKTVSLSSFPKIATFKKENFRRKILSFSFGFFFMRFIRWCIFHSSCGRPRTREKNGGGRV